jgi:circadian clock protein KaiC
MRSIGIGLRPYIDSGLLQIHSARATVYGLEMHLATIHKLINTVSPKVVVVDPIGSLIQSGTRQDAHSMVIRLIDFLKSRRITTLLTNLTSGGTALERTDVAISSIVDTWLLLRDIELNGERNRAMYVLKSRGMRHSNQLREFLLTDKGIDLLDVYVGPEGVLTGSSRATLEARDKASAIALRQELDRKERDRERKREALEARITAMRKEFEIEDAELALLASQDLKRAETQAKERRTMAVIRQADEAATDNNRNARR